ncbi:hypothetical protein Pla108_14250 [Botrimarina colliarenosi]|uniref:Xylose isomerase-like TIM barrel domain-containing protein n=2 Tax=Botrimarina colliarenosi TaxID=2528001 RepID=A0A5C6AQK2_9BACT|nr:hypothetical protein Pla108_14250 [Botrimarina colliarenosi]
MIEPSPSVAWVRDQIGEPQIRFLDAFLKNHLGANGPTHRELTYSVRPSIVARSECELLSVSAPRFAIRTFLPDGSMLQLRRLQFLSKSCRDLFTSDPEAEPLNQMLSVSLSLDTTGLADSILVPPAQLTAAEWHILTSNIAAYYLEEDLPLPSPGVPFLQHVGIGRGGMCQQAACFMANGILLQHANAIFGPTEITALSQPSRSVASESEAVLSGMTMEAARKYMRSSHVGLTAFHHTQESLWRRGCDGARMGVADHQFATLIRAYVLSGMPVILNTDMSKLLRTPGYSEFAAAESSIRRPHAVVVVGCKKCRPSSFLINDPSTFPFIELSETSLLEVLSRDAEGRRDSESILAVLPRCVTVPLAYDKRKGAKGDGGAPLGMSVFDILMLFQEHCPEELRPLFPEGQAVLRKDDEIRLLMSADETDAGAARVLAIGDNLHPQAIGVIEEWLRSSGGRLSSAYWSVHRKIAISNTETREAIVLIDATASAFRGRGYHMGLDLPRFAAIKNPKDQSWRPLRLGVGPVRLSAITSMTTAPSAVAARLPQFSSDPPLIEGVEWYTLMQTDVEASPLRKLATSHSINFDTAADFMAACESLQPEPRQAIIDQAIRSADFTCPVIGIASFIPSMSLPPSCRGAETARRAIRFVSRLGASITKQRLVSGIASDRPFVVELVAGSRVTSLFKSNGAADRYSMSYENEEVALDNFVENLRLTIGELRASISGVAWAVELEPGPLFTINGIESLEAFCARLDNDPLLNDRVGVNLDISHLRMTCVQGVAGIDERVSAARVRDSPIFRRIVHAHISGHCQKAHFGDRALSLKDSRATYGPWIALLAQRAGIRNAPIPFSGYVSLELEATRDAVYATVATRDAAVILSQLQSDAVFVR